MPENDEAIMFDLPWVKTDKMTDARDINKIVSTIRDKRFDGAVIFTVYSQNPLPTAMLAYMAGIPKVLAYCRENSYGLLTHWVPEKEPYALIKHQVRRDLDLVKTIGAVTGIENLYLRVDDDLWPGIISKLTSAGIQIDKPWIILHAGVSEMKRRYSYSK